jgi:hypothetical protein
MTKCQTVARIGIGSQINLNFYNTTFDVPDVHFDQSCLVSDAQAENYGNPK